MAMFADKAVALALQVGWPQLAADSDGFECMLPPFARSRSESWRADLAEVQIRLAGTHGNESRPPMVSVYTDSIRTEPVEFIGLGAGLENTFETRVVERIGMFLHAESLDHLRVLHNGVNTILYSAYRWFLEELEFDSLRFDSGTATTSRPDFLPNANGGFECRIFWEFSGVLTLPKVPADVFTTRQLHFFDENVTVDSIPGGVTDDHSQPN